MKKQLKNNLDNIEKFQEFLDKSGTMKYNIVLNCIDERIEDKEKNACVVNLTGQMSISLWDAIYDDLKKQAANIKIELDENDK